MTPFEVGQIKAHAYHGLGATDIAGILKRADGSHPSVQAVLDILQKLEDPTWRGERAAGSGRHRVTTSAVDKLIVKEVFKSRGSRKA